VGWWSDLQEENQDAEMPEAGRHSCWELQKARFEVFPADLHWSKVRPTTQCWWCQGATQTRDHFFKVCPMWKGQRKILWAEARKETGRRQSWWNIRDLLADERYGQAVLDFLTSTDVGRLVPAVEAGDAGSDVSEWELRELREREDELRAEAAVLGAEDELGDWEGLPLSYPRPPSWHRRARSRGWVTLFFGTSFVIFLGAHLLSLGQAWAEGKRELATSRHRANSGQEYGPYIASP
jgi:hypothetical protein